MKPDTSCPPLYPDAIPLWLYPDLFDETKVVTHRGWKFVSLYALSIMLNGLIYFIPIGLYKGAGAYQATLFVWLALTLPSGILLGLGVWRDFNRAEREANQKNESPQ